MRLDVFLTAGELAPGELTGRVVAVIDVLRASTTIAAALANGARAVIPFEDTDEMLTRAKQFERAAVLLAGERKMLPIPGFQFGNSPLEFTADAVSGKTVLLSTTNGTRALLATQGAAEVVVASYGNCAVVTALLRAALRGGADVAIMCAGQDGHYALEDGACAGRYVRAAMRRMADLRLNDAAQSCALLARSYGDNISAVFLASTHGRALIDAGFKNDVDVCAQIDAFPVVPVYADRQITKLGPERER
ncbi:MAG: 2-phosphosulfolactate phosphatase [Gemmatimonadaceae bacterium]